MIVYSLHTITALLESNKMNNGQLFVEQQRSVKFKHIIQLAKKQSWQVNLIQSIDRQFNTSKHNGIAASFDFHWSSLKDLNIKNNSRFLMLDRIQDPHNFGACIRSATAFDISAIIIPQRDQAPLSETVHKTSSGGTVITPIIKVSNLNQAISEMKDQGIWFIATDEHADTTIHDIDLDRPICLVMGSEGHGVKHKIKSSCDYRIKIDTSPKLPTLNVSVATGILLSQLYTKY